MRCLVFVVAAVAWISATGQLGFTQIDEQYSTRRNSQHRTPAQPIRFQERDASLQLREPTIIPPSTQQDDSDLAPGTAPGQDAAMVDSENSTEQQSVVEPTMQFQNPATSPAQSATVTDWATQNNPAAGTDPYGCGYDACGCDLFCNCGPRRLFPSTCQGLQLTGWLQGGYHSDSTGLLNNRPDELNLHQGWFSLERRAQNCGCGWDWGFGFDAVYGTDARFLQSFGNNAGEFDFRNGLDYGSYAWALPQLYGEIRSGNWGVRAGHFLADFNYEGYRSPNNFFYSRSYASVLASPATLTGILASYDDGCSVWTGGYVAGWDTGFDQFGNGGAFHGSVRRRLSNQSFVSYTVSAGDFGRRGDGYAHSIIYDRNFCCRWNYAFETSLLQSNVPGAGSNDNVGLAQYLTYRWSNKVDFGQRLEWWKSDINGLGSQSTYAYTAGLNFRVNSNVVVRPELRYNWGAQFNNAAMQTAIFGIDAVVRF